jgi:hypothetical protein
MCEQLEMYVRRNIKIWNPMCSCVTYCKRISMGKLCKFDKQKMDEKDPFGFREAYPLPTKKDY